MKSVLTVVLVLFPLVAYGASSIHTEPVDYSAQGVVMKGYLAYDENIKGKRPGILVVHEWWGLNDYAKQRARMLAELGYTALAVDMYGEGKQAMHPDDAGKFSSELREKMDVAKARFLAALDVLKKNPTVDPNRIAAIGYCFGGGVVLQMVRDGVDLRGVVSFHGSLATNHPAKRGAVKAKILVAHGADDQFITKEQVEAFKKEMKDAGADMRFIAYPGARHSFTNPDADVNGKKFNIPLAYNAEADKKSWEDMQKFFAEIFK
ncbi:MAG: dienelactone hydrolase family protein [bacterium]